MSAYTRLVRPLLFRCDAERVHDRATRAGRLVGSLAPLRGLLSSLYRFSDPRLESEVCGIRFPTPFGLSAGYDKSGHALGALGRVNLPYGGPHVNQHSECCFTCIGRNSLLI